MAVVRRHLQTGLATPGFVLVTNWNGKLLLKIVFPRDGLQNKASMYTDENILLTCSAFSHDTWNCRLVSGTYRILRLIYTGVRASTAPGCIVRIALPGDLVHKIPPELTDELCLQSPDCLEAGAVGAEG